MKEYLKKNIVPVIIGIVIGQLTIVIINTIEDIITKIALIMIK